MKLEDIGFYTLSDERAKTATHRTRLERCELILTDKCNFNCPYCRGIESKYKGTMSFEKAKFIVNYWASQNLRNIRFSGGEPTLYHDLIELVEYTKSKGIERIAISTNGSADLDLYFKLVDAGVNDFSISLDACCASEFAKISRSKNVAWEKFITNLKELSKITYVTVGIVLFDDNEKQVKDIIEFASES